MRILGTALLIMLIMTLAAYGHSWYPPACCSGRDCAPLEAGRVKITANGYLIDGRFLVLQRDARPSPDGQYHGCWQKPDMPPRCFFAPPQGS